MTSKFRDALDPLDLEILERALDGALATLKEDEARADRDSDEALEANLRRELIEIARFNGVSDPETLRDILLAALSQPGCEGRPNQADKGAGSDPQPLACQS